MADNVFIALQNNEEARHIMETSPGVGNLVEILMYAGNLWEEWGHEEEARMVRRHAASLRGDRPREAGDLSG